MNLVDWVKQERSKMQYDTTASDLKELAAELVSQ